MSACSLCMRSTQAVTGRGRLMLLCRHCFGKDVVIRTASKEDLPHVRTFYVSSFVAPKERWRDEYVVKKFGEQMTCTCDAWVHRGQILNQACKHMRLVQLLAKAAGGWVRIPAGMVLPLRLGDEAVEQPQSVRSQKRHKGRD